MKHRSFMLLMLVLAAGTVACARSERYGALDASAPAVQVKDLLLSDSYGGKKVRLSGKIALQCASTGCWFFLDDGTGRLLVDLKGLGLGLPPRGGRKAQVSGTVVMDENGQPALTATGLEIS